MPDAIFTVTSTATAKAPSKSGLRPGASAGPSLASILNVAMTSDGKLMLDGIETDEDTLAATVRRKRAAHEEVRAAITADKAVLHGQVVHLIDVLKTNGVASFTLDLEPGTKPEQSTE